MPLILVFASYVAFLALLIPCLMGTLWDGGVHEVHVKDAASYYAANVAPLFRLPKEAVITEVTTTGDYFPETYSVVFSLPTTQSSREWMKAIWRANSLPESTWDEKGKEYRVNWVGRKPETAQEVQSRTKWGERRLLPLEKGSFLLQVHGLELPKGRE